MKAHSGFYMEMIADLEKERDALKAQLVVARAERLLAEGRLVRTWDALHDWLSHEPGGTERFTKTLNLLEELRRAYP